MKTCDECLYWDDFEGNCWCLRSNNYLREVSGLKEACVDFRPNEETEQEDENEDDA